MARFVACRLHFLCEAVTSIELPRYKGSVLRGAFFGALRHDFCLNKTAKSCLSCPAAEACPICKLVATVDRENPRGAEVPRPFALEPIRSEAVRHEAGDTLSFGITLFGQALPLFPYVILAIQHMGELGIGNRNRVPGRFLLREAWVVNPLTGVEKRIYSQATGAVSVPDLPVTYQDVVRYSASLPQDRIRLDLLTPLRLVVEGALVHELSFRPLVQRLLRRLTDLYHQCCGEELTLDFAGLLRQAAGVMVAEDRTSWLDISSYSRRLQASTPIGGLVGGITFEGQLGPFLPFLVWGQFTHVGKDATKGNGWYQIAGSSS